MFIEEISKTGVAVFEDATTILMYIKKIGLKIGLATSSKNAPLILEQTDLKKYFDVVVDGTDAGKMELKSKPSPDIFLCVSKLLGVPFSQCVVIEDSHEALIQVANSSPAAAIGVDRNSADGTHDRFSGLPVITDLRALIHLNTDE